jgi:hypothetical protein
MTRVSSFLHDVGPSYIPAVLHTADAGFGEAIGCTLPRILSIASHFIIFLITRSWLQRRVVTYHRYILYQARINALQPCSPAAREVPER